MMAKKGRFGEYGGQYVPETLMPALIELEEEFHQAMKDKAFLEEDKQRPDAVSATQADAQGPHEAIIRAGEDRILNWMPALSKGSYTVEAKLIYDLNRYNDRSFLADQTETNRASLLVNVK